MFWNNKLIFAFMLILIVLIGLNFGIFYGCGYVGNEKPVVTTTTTTTVPGPTKQWHEETLIDTNVTGSQNHHIVMDGEGDALLVWAKGNSLKARKFNHDLATWEPESVISSIGGEIFDCKLVMIDNGNAIATWIQKKGDGNEHLFSNQYNKVSGWSGGSELMTLLGQEYSLNLKMDQNGNAMAVIIQDELVDEVTTEVYTVSYEAGVGWGAPEQKRDPDYAEGSYEIGYLDIGLSGNGSHMIEVYEVWVGEFDMKLYSRRYESGTGWGDKEVVDDLSTFATDAQTLIDDYGNALVVWDGDFNVYSKRYDAAEKKWGPRQKIVDGIKSQSFELTLDKNAIPLILWMDSSTANSKIYLKKYDATVSAWGPAKLISERASGDIERYQLVESANGDLLVIWDQDYDYNLHIWQRFYDAASDQWLPSDLMEALSGFSSRPEAAMDDEGNAIAVWLNYLFGDNYMYVKRYY